MEELGLDANAQERLKQALKLRMDPSKGTIVVVEQPPWAANDVDNDDLASMLAGHGLAHLISKFVDEDLTLSLCVH